MQNLKFKKLDDIKRSLEQLAEKHQNYKDDGDAELIELDAQDIICNYCLEHNYEVNGFPNKLTSKDIDIEEYYELYDSSVFEAYNQYIDYLALEKGDVAELMWYYTKSFWPDQFVSKTVYLENLKGLLESGVVYDFKL